MEEYNKRVAAEESQGENIVLGIWCALMLSTIIFGMDYRSCTPAGWGTFALVPLGFAVLGLLAIPFVILGHLWSGKPQNIKPYLAKLWKRVSAHYFRAPKMWVVTSFILLVFGYTMLYRYELRDVPRGNDDYNVGVYDRFLGTYKVVMPPPSDQCWARD